VAVGTRARAVALLGALLAAAGGAWPAPAAAQTIEAVPERTTVTVGDSIAFQLTVRLGAPDATLAARVPEAEGVLPMGMHVSADSVVRTGAGTFEGRAVVVFFRPGRQTVPSFALSYRPAPSAPAAIVRSEPVRIEVAPTLTPGGQQLKDIKGLVPTPGSGALPYAMALASLAAAGALAAGLRRRSSTPPLMAPPPPPAPLAPYELAVERLAAIAAERWPARGEVARHYEEVTDVLRRYLEEAERVPARELTTSALVRALPAPLAGGGLRGQCRDLLAEADLVKFARARPSEAQATRFLTRARDLLGRWRDASRPAPVVAAGHARPDAAPVVAPDEEGRLNAVR
jgi:hypothetical protein